MIIKKKRINSLLVTSGYGYYLVAAYYTHKFTSIPFYIYMFDLWSPQQLISRIHRLILAIYEKKILTTADRVFVMSEKLRDYYAQIAVKKPLVIQHSVDLDEYNGVGVISHSINIKRIVFTGLINNAHLDSILNMVSVVENYERLLFFDIYTPTDFKIIKELGVVGYRINVRYVLSDEIPKIQKNADILFLPLSFTSHGEIIRYASPGKLPEYLAAGVPILVHAPRDSYIAWYAKKHGFALVVDQPEPIYLENAVKKILYDTTTRNYLRRNSKKILPMHDSKKISSKFKKHIFSKDI